MANMSYRAKITLTHMESRSLYNSEIYARRKIVCLFVMWRFLQTKVPIAPTLGTIGKPLMSGGAMSWFHNISTYSEKVIEY
jgi:hypothetical protein